VDDVDANLPIEQLLARVEARADEIAAEITACTLTEVEPFRGGADPSVQAEIRRLAASHLEALVRSARNGDPLDEAVANARERAVERARAMLPLSALVHSQLVAQRVISAAVAREAEADVLSRDAALELTAKTFEYTIATTSAMAQGYLAVVQGDLAELHSARRALIDILLTGDRERRPELAGRASGLGLDAERELVAVVAVVVSDGQREPVRPVPRWVAQAIARCSGSPERTAFVVSRERDVVAVLHASGSHSAAAVLERAVLAIRQLRPVELRAGVGVPFSTLDGFSESYREAYRALRHTSGSRPVVSGPHEVSLFDELTISAREDAQTLIPEATRRLLANHSIRETVEALFDADLQVSVAAKALALHPNSLRYRLGRIADLTGRDPRRLTDLLELITASRLLADGDGRAVSGGSGWTDR
jgi:hypothetical protein